MAVEPPRRIGRLEHVPVALFLGQDRERRLVVEDLRALRVIRADVERVDAAARLLAEVDLHFLRVALLREPERCLALEELLPVGVLRDPVDPALRAVDERGEDDRGRTVRLVLREDVARLRLLLREGVFRLLERHAEKVEGAL